jgi:hypothetical protein
LNSKHGVSFKPHEILGEPSILGDLDLMADNPEFLTFKTDMIVHHDGHIDGLGGWFECQLAEGVWMTNSPVAPGAINRPQAFLPIEAALAVKAGDLLQATLSFRPSDDLINWTLTAPASGQRFSHSTWKSKLLASRDLLRAQPDRVPQVNRNGLARRTVMSYCDGQRSAREIEQAVLRDHPELFPTPAEISRFVIGTLAMDAE